MRFTDTYGCRDGGGGLGVGLGPTPSFCPESRAGPAKLPRRPQGRSCRPATLLARLTSNWHVSLNIQETPLSNIMQHLDIQGDMQIRCEEGRLDGTWVLTPLSLSARRDFPISLTGGGEREKGRIGFAHIEVRRVRLGATCEDGDDDRD